MTATGPSAGARPLSAPANVMLRLLVAGQDAGVDAVLVAHARDERRAVGRVAGRAGQDADHALGVELRRSSCGTRSSAATTRAIASSASAPVRVDALAESRDCRAALELVDVGAGDVGDEQPGRVLPMSTTATRIGRRTVLRRAVTNGALGVQ